MLFLFFYSFTHQQECSPSLADWFLFILTHEVNPFEHRCTGSLLTRVRKSCTGRVALPGQAHQVTAEAGEEGAVWTTPANSAAA